MRSKILYLITSIFLLVIFTRCEDSLTITANQNQDNDLIEVRLDSPEDGSEQSTAVELDWSQVEEANSYKLQLSTDSEFSSIIVDSLTAESSFQIKGLPSDTALYWQVRPVVDGNEGPWSTTWQFYTEPTSQDSEPVATDLTSPSDGASKSPFSVTFSWTAIASASTYNIQVASDQEFNTLVIDQETSSSSYETTELSAEQTFYWRVEPVVSSGETQWSEIFEFATLGEDEIPAPAQVSPDDGAVDVELQPTFEWEEVDGADHYILHANSVDPTEMVVETEVEGTAFTPESDLATQTSHDWRVRAVIGDTEGEWSDIHEFTTGLGEDDSDNSTVSLNAPANGASSQSTSPSLDWDTVSGASEYHVQLATNSSFSSPVLDEVIAESSYDVTGLDYSETYYWRVQVTGDGDSENWSTVYSFTTESESANDDNGDYANSVEGDRQALMDLYEATGGSSWSNDSGWGSGNPDNSWHGVEVNGSGRVVRLDLQDNGLEGQLPESIGNLTKVRYLNVVRNNLSGTIPSSIGNFASVEWLRLSGTGGDDLDNVGHHPSKSDNSGNSFSGTMPPELGQLKNLRYLQIDGNNFSGSIPSELGNAESLVGLYLNWGTLSGSIPGELGQLSNLRFLHLSENDFSGSLPPEIGNIETLQVLRLKENNLDGSIPDSYSSLTNLMWAIFDKNQLSGDWPQWWNNGNFSQINTLRGEWNNFTGTLHGFDNLTNLKSFSVTGNDMSGTLPESITAPKRVKNFTFGWNNFEGQIPQEGWDEFSNMRQLRLNSNNLEGPIPDELPNSSDLQYLYFQGNELSGEVSTNHGKYADSSAYPKFNYINIGGNNFSSADYQDLVDILGNKLKY